MHMVAHCDLCEIAVCEIFNVKELCDLENRVSVRSLVVFTSKYDWCLKALGYMLLYHITCLQLPVSHHGCIEPNVCRISCILMANSLQFKFVV